MTDSRRPNLEDRIERYARGELTAAEARELAQESLDSPELFEQLTYSALAKKVLSTESIPGAKVVPFPRRARFVVAAAAAIVAVVSVYFLRSPREQPSVIVAGPQLKPTLAFAVSSGQPVLLASDLQPVPGGRQEVFRGTAPAARAPRPTGTVVSIDDGLATIDLGSLDGLAKGSELETQSAGRIAVTTVFRERARGQIPAGAQVRVRDQVRVAPATHLSALLEQVDALSRQGNLNAARSAAEQALRWAETAGVPPGEKRKSLERLGALEYQTGALEAAEAHYQSAVDNSSPGERSAVLNSLAVLHMLREDYPGAEALLRQAVSASAKTGLAFAQTANNLGVLAELRQDRRLAASHYTEALRALPAEPQKQVVESNLARIQKMQ